MCLDVGGDGFGRRFGSRMLHWFGWGSMGGGLGRRLREGVGLCVEVRVGMMVGSTPGLCS